MNLIRNCNKKICGTKDSSSVPNLIYRVGNATLNKQME